METVPLWMHVQLAETLARDGAVPDIARVHCPYWVGRAHAGFGLLGRGTPPGGGADRCRRAPGSTPAAARRW